MALFYAELNFGEDISQEIEEFILSEVCPWEKVHRCMAESSSCNSHQTFISETNIDTKKALEESLLQKSTLPKYDWDNILKVWKKCAYSEVGGV